MTTSDKGLRFISHFEGVVCKIYADPVGLWTGGVGHLLTAEEKKKFTLDDPLTLDQVENWLRNDVKKAELCVSDLVHIEIDQSQFDSLVSFVFNVGEGNFKTSTLLKKLNSGETEAAGDEFLRWTHAGSKTLPGLVKRREAERNLFLKGIYQ